MVALAVGGCGKDKDAAGGGGGAAAGGASCGDAAANYVALELASKLPTPLTKMNPTPDQRTALAAAIANHCETGAHGETASKPWSAKTRGCVAAARAGDKLGDAPVAACFQDMGRGYSLQVAQIVHDFVQAETAKVPTAPAPTPP